MQDCIHHGHLKASVVQMLVQRSGGLKCLLTTIEDMAKRSLCYKGNSRKHKSPDIFLFPTRTCACQRAQHRIKWSEFDSWLGSFCCVLTQEHGQGSYDKFSSLSMFKNFLRATYFNLLDTTHNINMPCT